MPRGERRPLIVPENRAAWLAVRRLESAIVSAKRRPTLVLFHGPPGTGKTHLVRWLVNRLAEAERSVRVLAAGDLAVEPSVLAGAKACDLLIVEDLQLLAERAADRLDRILDYRRPRRQPTLITCSVGPGQLPLPPRLASRLSAALLVGMQRLSAKSRRHVLRSMTARRSPVTKPALERLARELPGSFRALTGMMATLNRLSKSSPQLLDEQQLAPLLADHVRPKTADDIIRKVARFFGVDPRRIRGDSRAVSIAWPRQVAMALARDVLDVSYAKVGQAFGRDATTVRHACVVTAKARQGDPKHSAEWEQLRASFS